MAPQRGLGAERRSAQVRTRLRFRHPRAAAGGAGSELEKVGPVRPLVPGEPRSLQRRRRLQARGTRHLNWGTQAASSQKMPAHPHPRASPTLRGCRRVPPQWLPPGKGPPPRPGWGREGAPRAREWGTPQTPLRGRDLRGWMCATSEAAPPLVAPRLRGRRIAPGWRDGAGRSLTGRGGGVSPRGRCQHLDGLEEAGVSKRRPPHAPGSPITYAAREEGPRAASPTQSPGPALGGQCNRGAGLSRLPPSRLARLPEAHDTAITLNGNAPRGSVLSPSPAWGGTQEARSSGNSSTKLVVGSSQTPRLRGFTRAPGCGGVRA